VRASVYTVPLLFHPEFDGADIPLLLGRTRQSAERKLAELAVELIPAELRGCCLVAPVAPLAEIPRVAAEERFGLIVCAINSAAGMRYAFLGSTAEGIIRHAPCPVLVVPG